MHVVFDFAAGRPGRVDLPVPPSANRLWRVGRTGSRKRSRGGRGRGRPRLVKSHAYEVWLAQALPALRAGLSRPALPTGVQITVRGGAGWSARRDIDNVCKPVVDALVAAGVLPDDSSRYVHRVRVDFVPAADGRPAGCEVRFEEVPRA